MPALQIKVADKLQIKTEHYSPRSSNSATSIETATLTAGRGSAEMTHLRHVTEAQDHSVAAEVKALLDMAANRLLSGDLHLSMRYVALAQQVQNEHYY
jgi:hypothetical protein